MALHFKWSQRMYYSEKATAANAIQTPKPKVNPPKTGTRLSFAILNTTLLTLLALGMLNHIQNIDLIILTKHSHRHIF